MESLTELALKLMEEDGVVLIEVVGDTIHVELLDDPDEP